MPNEHENELTKKLWPVYDLNGIKVRPIEILVKDKTILGILYSMNEIFVPVNSTSEHPLLEAMKEHNKSLIEKAELPRYVEPVKDLLGVPHGSNVNGCWTEIQHKFNSAGVTFILRGSEGMPRSELFLKLEEIYPHLKFNVSDFVPNLGSQLEV